jgi:hypothetical protein
MMLVWAASTLNRAGDYEDPLLRLLVVVTWYFSRYHIAGATDVGKKPYNPILGEQFFCKWEDDAGESLALISEQVSHHPPITAEYYYSTRERISNNSHYRLKTKFSGMTVKANVEGSNVTTVFSRNGETYVSTFPSFLVRGFFTGTPFFDQVGEATVTCEQTGLQAVIDFKDKPWFRGSYHDISGHVHRLSDKTVLGKLSGNWRKKIFFQPTGAHKPENLSGPLTRSGKDPRGLKSVLTSKDNIELFSCEETPHKPVIKSPEEQGDLESQKIWKNVTKALMAWDFLGANSFKSEIEENQRKLARERHETGEEWVPKFFKWNQAGEEPESGVWAIKCVNHFFFSLFRCFASHLLMSF